MIAKETILDLTESFLTDDYFIVSIQVKKGNLIEVIIDGENGVSIQKCVDLSRHIESNLDRDVEDFELNVSSAGIGRPLKVYRQYEKQIGRKVEVVPKDGKPLSGEMKSVDEKGFDIEVTTIEKNEKKKKVEVKKNHRFLFDDGPVVKSIVTFK